MSLREELEKVIGLSEAATSGPWEACDRGSYGEENEGSVWNDFMHDIDAVSTVRPLSSQNTIRGDTTMRDASFIAAVANLIRDHGQALVEAVEISEELICCTGHDCGCQGATRAEYQAAMNQIARSKTVDGGGA